LDPQKFHGKRYRSEGHHDKAQENFKNNKMEVQAHNKLFEEGKVLHKMGKSQVAPYIPI